MALCNRNNADFNAQMLASWYFLSESYVQGYGEGTPFRYLSLDFSTLLCPTGLIVYYKEAPRGRLPFPPLLNVLPSGNVKFL